MRVAKVLSLSSLDRRSSRAAALAASLAVVVSGVGAAIAQTSTGATVNTTVTGSGRMTVRVMGANRWSPMTVHIESSRAGTQAVLTPGETSLTKQGLAFDTYHVSAIQDEVLVTEIKAVRLDELHPAASVDLEISENRSALILSDPSGRPVRKAFVRPMRPGDPHFLRSGLDVRETEPGRYPLDGVRPGIPLLIRTNSFVPICRVVQRHEALLVTLEPGRQIEVQFPRDITIAVARELAALSDVPGSDCPIPLSAFGPEAVTSAVAPLLFRFDHFSSSPRFVLRRPGMTRQILVADSGPVVVESESIEK